jgi:putative SOS response-associated peptidase YedK
MCNLYRLTTTAEAMRDLFRAMEGEAPNLPPALDIYPGHAAPVVLREDQGRRLARMTWGVPPPPGVARPITNVRNLASPFWRPMLGQAHRALVPVSAFAEWKEHPDLATGRKRKIWFQLRSAPLFAFAGLWRLAEGEPRFAFLTCPPNATVGAVHPKAMPVLLSGALPEAWLEGEDARAFQKPWPDEDMMTLS